MASGCTTVHTKDLWNVQFQPVLQTQKTFPIGKVKIDQIFIVIKFKIKSKSGFIKLVYSSKIKLINE